MKEGKGTYEFATTACVFEDKSRHGEVVPSDEVEGGITVLGYIVESLEVINSE